jgi:hypothetical protein
MTPPRPCPRELRRFGLIVGGIFLVLSGISRWRGRVVPPLLLGTAGGLLVLAGLVAPRLLDPVERLWMRFAESLGRVNARIILTLIFYLVVTPFGLVRGLVRGSTDRRIRDGRGSLWVQRRSGPVDPARYRQQF